MNFIMTSFSGMLYRAIPHVSSDPLDTSHNLHDGGRWNPAGSFAVLHTFTSQQLARTFVLNKYSKFGFSPAEVQPENQYDLLILGCEADRLVDAVTDAGLAALGLPITYPVGFLAPVSYVTTRNIGIQIDTRGDAGILARSATATRWDGPLLNSSDLALFVNHAPPVSIVDRIEKQDWLL